MNRSLLFGISSAILGLLVLLLLEHRTVTRLREENMNLRRQVDTGQAKLTHEREAVADQTQPAPGAYRLLSQREVLELLRLRGEATVLRAEAAGRSISSTAESGMEHVEQGTSEWDGGLVLTVDKHDLNGLHGIRLYNAQTETQISADVGTVSPGPNPNSVALELQGVTGRSTNGGRISFFTTEKFSILLAKGATSE